MHRWPATFVPRTPAWLCARQCRVRHQLAYGRTLASLPLAATCPGTVPSCDHTTSYAHSSTISSPSLAPVSSPAPVPPAPAPPAPAHKPFHSSKSPSSSEPTIHPVAADIAKSRKSAIAFVARFEHNLAGAVPTGTYDDQIYGSRAPELHLPALWLDYQEIRRSLFHLRLLSPVTWERLLAVILGRIEEIDSISGWWQAPDQAARQMPGSFKSMAWRSRVTYANIVNQLLDDLTTVAGITPSWTVYELALMIYSRTHAWQAMEALWARAADGWTRDFEAGTASLTTTLPAATGSHLPGYLPEDAGFQRHVMRMASARVLYFARAVNVARCEAIVSEIQFLFNVQLSRCLLSLLLWANAQAGQISAAEQLRLTLAEEGHPLNTHDANALLAAYARVRDTAKLEALFAELTAGPLQDLRPNSATYRILIHYHLDLCNYPRVHELLEAARRTFSSTASLNTVALVRRLVDKGLLAEANAALYVTPAVFCSPAFTSVHRTFMHRSIYANDPAGALDAFENLLVRTGLLSTTTSTSTTTVAAAATSSSSRTPTRKATRIWLRAESSFLYLYLWLCRRGSHDYLAKLIDLAKKVGLRLGATSQALILNATEVEAYSSPLTATPTAPADPLTLVRPLLTQPGPTTLAELIRTHCPALLSSATTADSDPPSPAPLPQGSSASYDILIEILATRHGIDHHRAFETVTKFLTDARDYTGAYAFFTYMVGQGYLPSVFAYTLILRGLVRRGLVVAAERLRQRMADDFGLQASPNALKSILAGHLRHGNTEAARHLFNELADLNAAYKSFSSGLTRRQGPSPTGRHLPFDLQGYTVIMQFLCQQGETSMVEFCYQSLLRLGIRPDLKVYNVLLRTYAAVSDAAKCRDIYRTLLAADLHPNSETAFLMVKMAALHGTLHDLSVYFNDLSRRDVRFSTYAYNHVIQALVRHPRGMDAALKVFRRMWYDSVPSGTPFRAKPIPYSCDSFERSPTAVNLFGQLLDPALAMEATQSADRAAAAATATSSSTRTSTTTLDTLAEIIPPPCVDEESGDKLASGDRAYNPYLSHSHVAAFHHPDYPYGEARPPCPNSLTFKILIRAAARQHQWHLTTALFELQRASLFFSPDLRTYGWAITAYSQLNDHPSALRYWLEFQSAPSFQVAQTYYHWTTLKSLVRLNLHHAQVRRLDDGTQ